MLLPYSGIFPINAFFAEHFIYIASLGILVIFVYFLQKLNSKRIFKLVFFGYLAVFSIATIKYNFVWQDQVKLYQRIIKLSPNSFAAYNNLGVIYLTQGRLKAAESMIKKSLEVYPECIEARVNLARFYYFKKDYSTAIGLVKAVVENDPRNFEALDFLGTFYFKNKEFDLAEYCYKKAMAVNPYYLPIWLDLYSFYKSLGREKEAVAVREEIKKIDRYSLADLNFADAQELFLENKIDKPLVLIDEALKVDPYNSDYYNLKGAILRRSGNYAQALDSFRKALKISPVNYEAYNNLGNLFAMIGDFDKARMNFKKSISLNPDFTEGYFNLGLLYFMLKNKPEAERLFRKALSLNPNHSLAKEYLDKIQKER
jgi:tetratricopeptide (TPR) repeat protein